MATVFALIVNSAALTILFVMVKSLLPISTTVGTPVSSSPESSLPTKLTATLRTSETALHWRCGAVFLLNLLPLRCSGAATGLVCNVPGFPRCRSGRDSARPHIRPLHSSAP